MDYATYTPPPAHVKDADPPPDPPAELLLAFWCEQFQALPDVGAILDQDYQMLTRMNGLMSIYKAVKRWNTSGGEKIHNLTETDRRVLKRLQDMGLMFNA